MSLDWTDGIIAFRCGSKKVAGVAKSADARDLKSLGGNTVPVQVRSPAPECLRLRIRGH